MFTALGLDLETYGNAFLQVIRAGAAGAGSRIVGLRRLPAITMSRYRRGFMQRVSRPDGQTRKITFTGREIVHLKELCPEGRRYALPTWIGVRDMLELAHAATRYNATFFRNHAVPEYAVIFKGTTPTQQMKTDIQTFFRNEFQGFENAHRTLVLSHSEESEIKVERLTAQGKDGDFLRLLDAVRDRIPIAHGVPPRMLGIISAGQLGGGGEVSGQMFTFEHLTLKPKRRRMLDQLRPLLDELGLCPGTIEDGLADHQIAFRPLDLTPPRDDADHLPDLVQAGIVTEAEARALLPFVQERSAQGGQDRAQEDTITRSAPGTPAPHIEALPIETLAALLARL